MLSTKVMILACIFQLLTIGCGKKGSPVPRSSVVSQRIVDLEAKSREERLLLEWTFPKANTDKSTLTDLVEFKVLRAEGDLIANECKGCGEKAKVVFEAKLD